MGKDISNDVQLVFSVRDIKRFVKQLKMNEIGFFEVPEECRLHPIIVQAEREMGMRRSDKRGFDVIRNTFFVEEFVVLDEVDEKQIKNCFLDFASYYEFLDGDIYENACYFQYNFSQTEIDTYNIDLSKINTISLTNDTIDFFATELVEKELQEYNTLEKDKVTRKKWISKFNACNTYDEFKKVIINFKKTKFASSDLIFYFYNFIFSNKNKAFDIIMQYVSDGEYPSYCIERELCSIYVPERVLSAYSRNNGAKSTYYRRKKKLKDYIDCLRNNEIIFKHCDFFDEKTHFFCHQTLGYYKDRKILSYPDVQIYRYFDTFQELADYLKNDLSNCDFSKAMLPDVDFSIYKTNENTKLPIQSLDKLTYTIYKGYDRNADCFVVKQSWLDENNQIVKETKKKFDYFFDFLCFLNNDLSNADLLFCDGLNNLYDLSNIIFCNARLKSDVLDKIGTEYQFSSINTSRTESFPSAIDNEEKTASILLSKRESTRIEETSKKQKIYYVSDIHLLHRIKNAACKTENDVLYTIQKIIDKLLYEAGNVILIGGDTSSDFNIFRLFVQLLRKTLDEKQLDIQVIFLLGNHEVWEFSDLTFEEIIQTYKTVIEENKMYLLQNNIIYRGDDNNIKIITTDEIEILSRTIIRERLKDARIIIFGGLAFSGQNKDFNADNGIYRFTINREQEIMESKKFEELYNIVCEMLHDKKVIVFTHTPQNDWCSHICRQSGFVYVSGHTHRNYFFDDGVIRIYADNQIGYKYENPCLKYFYLENEYDLFSEYDNGIYEITKEQYINFYHGKNIPIQFTRKVNILYMLKKNGYYCFIHQSEYGQLTILNAGARKRLNIQDINYYYDRMDKVIAYIKKPLDKYSLIQKQIADEIKEIGGSGTIHGTIINIDFNNHVYVNPYDLSVTSYWASDIINKKVFPSIPKLLETNCPLLFLNYEKKLEGKTEKFLAISGDKTKEMSIFPYTYSDTDIYRESKEIKKMQKLYSNILATWYEPSGKLLE